MAWGCCPTNAEFHKKEFLSIKPGNISGWCFHHPMGENSMMFVWNGDDHVIIMTITTASSSTITVQKTDPQDLKNSLFNQQLRFPATPPGLASLLHLHQNLGEFRRGSPNSGIQQIGRWVMPKIPRSEKLMKLLRKLNPCVYCWKILDPHSKLSLYIYMCVFVNLSMYLFACIWILKNL